MKLTLELEKGEIHWGLVNFRQYIIDNAKQFGYTITETTVINNTINEDSVTSKKAKSK